jgi:hypothetical protein
VLTYWRNSGYLEDVARKKAATKETRPGDVDDIFIGPQGDPVIKARSTDGAWCCTAFLRLTTDRRWIIASYTVSPWADVPSGGATTATARSLPFGRWLAMAHARLPEMGDWLAKGTLPSGAPTMVLPQHVERARRLAELARGAELRKGRKGYPADHYRRIAFEYLDLQSQGVGRGIQRRLAEQQDPQRQWQTIRDWLAKATELGFLTKGTPGRAGREPGPNLYREEGPNQ